MEEKKEKIERTDITFEGTVAVWNMRTEGDIEGTYAGVFRFRSYLLPSQQISANREYRAMLGEYPSFAPEHESFLAYALTQLKYRILKAPPFWESTLNSTGVKGDVADNNIISEVLSAAIDAEVMYKQDLKKRREKSIDQAKAAAEKVNEQLEEDLEDANDDEGES